MTLQNYKILFIIVGLIGTLLFATSSLALTVRLPDGEKFSELWVLDPGRMTENYPFNVRENESYLVYVGVGNHIGSSAYYVLYVKFRNQTEPLPNATAGEPSVLAPLYEHRVFLEDGGSSEFPLTFSFSNVSFSGGQSTVGGLTINGVLYSVDKSVSWDSENTGYYYQLLFELWIYNVEAGVFQYHDRYCGIWLNMTLSSIS